MYDVIFMNDFHKTWSVIASGLGSLDEAREKRQVSGDVVAHHGTCVVVQSREWLWDWEKDETKYSYARNKATRHG